MADFISREAAIQLFNDWVDDLNKQINDSMNYPHLRSDYKVCKTQLLDCIHAIEEMPAIERNLKTERVMWEDIYQVYRRVGENYVDLMASDMTIENAIIFVEAWFRGNFNDQETSIEIRRQPINKDAEEEQK